MNIAPDSLYNLIYNEALLIDGSTNPSDFDLLNIRKYLPRIVFRKCDSISFTDFLDNKLFWVEKLFLDEDNKLIKEFVYEHHKYQSAQLSLRMREFSYENLTKLLIEIQANCYKRERVAEISLGMILASIIGINNRFNNFNIRGVISNEFVIIDNIKSISKYYIRELSGVESEPTYAPEPPKKKEVTVVKPSNPAAPLSKRYRSNDEWAGIDFIDFGSSSRLIRVLPFDSLDN